MQRIGSVFIAFLAVVCDVNGICSSVSFRKCIYISKYIWILLLDEIQHFAFFIKLNSFPADVA